MMRRHDRELQPEREKRHPHQSQAASTGFHHISAYLGHQLGRDMSTEAEPAASTK